MYAVIETGGKQYKVAKGDFVDIERLTGEKGDKISFDKILFIGDDKEPKFGRPYLEGAEVVGKVASQFRDKKIIIFKKKRRKGYEVRRGHRQNKTKVEITSIKG